MILKLIVKPLLGPLKLLERGNMEELDYKSSWTMPKRSRKLLCNSRKKKRVKDAKSMELHMSGGPTWIFLTA